MFVKGIIIVLGLALCASCHPKDEENVPEPAYILSQPVFIKVLTDCYLGEGAAGINVKNITGPQFDSAYVFNPFKDNGISKQQFDTTVVWYSQHPKKLKEIYSQVLENLSRIQAVGTLGGSRIAENKYAGRDARFFMTHSVIDAVENAKKKAGYFIHFSYLNP